MSIRSLDAADRHILEILQRDGSTTSAALGDATGLSASQCSRRVARLSEVGILAKNVWIVDPDQIDMGVAAFISVSIQRHAGKFEQLHELIEGSQEVMSCSMVAGEADYILQLRTRDNRSLKAFLERLTAIDIISTVKTTVVLDVMKSTTALPIG